MNPFLDWLVEVEQDQVVIDATQAGLETEARKNLWTFSLTEQQAQELKPEEVLHFLQTVISARERLITERFGHQHPMVFYCWFDELAAQLRFSLVSACHNQLPFKSRVNLVVELIFIVESFLASSYHNGIKAKDFGAALSDVPRSISVWAKQIPVSKPEQPAT